ncbi:MAG: aldo/keto reductase [Planctomycetes bacterium]|nr:aldo/keto reductase [Planctomycetota bacterium]
MKSRPTVTTRAGLEIPWIVYGTAWKKERTAGLVEQAVLAGFRAVDTACQPRHYREAGVGEALERLKARGVSRDSLVLQTKFTPADGQDPDNIPYDPSAPVDDQVRRSFEVSRANLKTDTIDSILLHSPLDSHEQTLRAWRALEEIHASGGVRQLGISNCYELPVLRALDADARVKPAVLQNRFYRKTGYDRELRAWCQAEGVIYQSFWSLTANPHVLKSGAVTALAEKLGRTPAQVFFRFLHQSGIVPLTGTTSPEHMAQDLDVPSFELSAGERESVEAELK